MSKYTMGARITSIQELYALCVLDNKSIFWLGKVVNAMWVRNQQFWWLCRFLNADKGFNYAIPKEKEK